MGQWGRHTETMRFMTPLQHTGGQGERGIAPAALDGESDGKAAGGALIHGVRARGREPHPPARGGGACRLACPMRQQQAGGLRTLSRESEAARRRQIERVETADDEGAGARFQRLLQRPQGFRRPRGFHFEEVCWIKPKS